jgi:[ribosomal protein S5]-alanine N-acetyltransferase
MDKAPRHKGRRAAAEPERLAAVNSVNAGPVVLEPQIAAHAAEMFMVLSDPAIYEFENTPPESVGWLTERFAGLESRISPDGAEQWLNWVIQLPSGALAGYVQATIASDRTAHIAYVLASRFWRQGIGSAAVSGMLKELAASYDVRTCVATLKERNHRSFALLQRLGFERCAFSGSDEVVMRKRISVVSRINAPP